RKRARSSASCAAPHSGSSRSSALRSSGCPAKTFTRPLTRGRRSDGERRAAAAGRLRVRIADDELRAGQRLGIVDLGAFEILQAERIDQQDDAVAIHGQVVLRTRFVEGEAVLEAGA